MNIWLVKLIKPTLALAAVCSVWDGTVVVYILLYAGSFDCVGIC